jgi:hypothetical protein
MEALGGAFDWVDLKIVSTRLDRGRGFSLSRDGVPMNIIPATVSSTLRYL